MSGPTRYRVAVKSCFCERLLKRAKGVVARGGQRALPTQRQRQRADVAVAARQGDELGVDGFESVQGGRGGSRDRDPAAPGPSATRAHVGRLSPRQPSAPPCATSRPRRTRRCAAPGAPGSRARRRPARATSASTRHLSFDAAERDDRVEAVPEGVGRLPRRAEGKPLRLEIGVLDRQPEDGAVERSIFAEPSVELVQQPDLVGVRELLQDRLQRLRVPLNRPRSPPPPRARLRSMPRRCPPSRPGSTHRRPW